MPADEAATRAQRDLVRRGYDVISRTYRTDDGASHPSTGEDPGRYRHWVAELAGLLPVRARWWTSAAAPESRLAPVWHRFVPEGNNGHGLILATAS